MAEHEIYKRKRSLNYGLGAVMVAFVVLVFAVTIVKVGSGAIKPEMAIPTSSNASSSSSTGESQ